MQTDEILGKPSGVTLEEHTSNVCREAKHILSARLFPAQKYRQFFETDLDQIVKECAQWHDEGKTHPRWQKACRLDFAEFWAWMQEHHPKARRQNAPRYFDRFQKDNKKGGQHLRRAKLRHEFHSLELRRKIKPRPSEIQYVAIAAHHAKLSEKQKKRFDDDPEFAKWRDKFFKEWGAIDGDDLQARNFEKFVLKRYQYDGPRALLQLADHRASAAESGDSLPKLEPFIYQFPHKDPKTGEPSLRGVQKIIRELWNEPLAILRAPTGAGKTDAALLWAEHQIKEGRADRLIIAMPTRFTSNALSISAAENLSQVGLYHSTSYFKRKRDALSKKQWNLEAVKKENELARQIQTPVTVTTLDHLCIALTGAREDHHAIFWGMAQSCVVIDEADFYDEFTQYNLVKLLEALRILKVRVLVMSATVPNSSLLLYSQSGFDVSRVWGDTPPEHWTEAEKQAMEHERVRPRCHVHIGRTVEIPADIADLLQKTLDGKPTIIYANTVKRAQAYVDWFKANGFHAKRDEEDTEKVFVLYHSRFTEPDKARKEDLLIQMLGADAWSEKRPGKPHGVAILTQIGELSVNISADYMICDFCPIDRMAQRAGRLSRFGSQIGELHVVTPLSRDKKDQVSVYPAPYGEYKSGHGWLMSEPFETSQQWLKNGPKSAQDWIDGVNCVYGELKKPSHETQRNQRELEKRLISNWMIVQAAEMEEDDEATGEWKSRNIPPQQEIFVYQDNISMVSDGNGLFFASRGHFREWKSQNVITVRSYEIKLAMDNKTVESIPVPVGEDTEDIFIADSKCYSFERGLVLTPQQDESEEEGWG